MHGVPVVRAARRRKDPTGDRPTMNHQVSAADAGEATQGYLFLAIDGASRWVYMEILGEKTAAQAADFRQRFVD